ATAFTMVTFTAHVRLRLRAPMKAEGDLQPIVLATSQPWAGSVTLLPQGDDGFVKALAAVVQVVQDGVRWKGRGVAMLEEPSGRVLLLAPDHLASRALAAALTTVAATTL